MHCQSRTGDICQGASVTVADVAVPGGQVGRVLGQGAEQAASWVPWSDGLDMLVLRVHSCATGQ